MKQLRFLSLLLTLLVATTIHAEIFKGNCGAQGGNVTYTLDTETGVLAIDGTGAMADYALIDPKYSDTTAPWGDSKFSYVKQLVVGRGVTEIGDYCFYGGDYINSVTLPNSLTCIGASSFQECSNLTEIKLPDSVKELGEYCFSDCRDLVSVELPNSLTHIGISCFNDCGIETMILPESLEYIGDCAFQNMNDIPALTIPQGVKELGYAFLANFGLLFVEDKSMVFFWPVYGEIERHVIVEPEYGDTMDPFYRYSHIVYMQDVDIVHGNVKGSPIVRSLNDFYLESSFDMSTDNIMFTLKPKLSGVQVNGVYYKKTGEEDFNKIAAPYVIEVADLNDEYIIKVDVTVDGINRSLYYSRTMKLGGINGIIYDKSNFKAVLRSNPVDGGTAWVKVGGASGQELRYCINSVSGQTVGGGVLSDHDGWNAIDASFPAGLYFLTVYDGMVSATVKMLVR